MNILSTILLVAIFMWGLALRAQDNGAKSGSSVSLDKANLEEVTTAVNASPSNQGELLFSAMHNNDGKIKTFCLERIGTLERVQQARLLSKILKDRKIILPVENIYDGWMGEYQAQLQVPLGRMANKLLGKTTDKFSPFTRSEIDALVSELDKIQ